MDKGRFALFCPLWLCKLTLLVSGHSRFNNPVSPNAIHTFRRPSARSGAHACPLCHTRKYTLQLSWASAWPIAPHRQTPVLSLHTRARMANNRLGLLRGLNVTVTETIRKTHLLTLSAYWASVCMNKRMPWFLCGLLKQPADHIGWIKALWQHPLHPSMTLEAQSGVLWGARTVCAKPVTYNVISKQPAKCSMHLFRCHQKQIKCTAYLSCQVRVSGFRPDSAHWDRRRLKDGRQHRLGARFHAASDVSLQAGTGQQRGTSRQGCFTVGTD